MKYLLMIIILFTVAISGDFYKYGTGGDFENLNYDKSTLGTGASGVNVKEYGNTWMHKTVITVSGEVDSINADTLAVGKELYTLPPGACIIQSAHINIALSGTDSIIDDTPDGGLGFKMANGTHINLSDTTEFEDILTGQTFTDADGTVEVKTVTGNDNVIEASDTTRTIYFNVADIWAGNDILGADGEVVIFWFMID